MLIKEALKIAVKTCGNITTPHLDSRVLLAHVLSVSQEQLLIRYSEELSVQEQSAFFSFIARRKNMEPVAYIVGKQEFYGRDYKINKNALIPRSETELIIDNILDDYKLRHNDKKVSILELGVGSGAVSVTIAKEIKNSIIIATDISHDALEVAIENAEIHEVSNQITFLESDWYNKVKKQKFDYIISNPPYISSIENALVSASTKLFEPSIALYSENNGLASYQAIAEQADTYLNSDGKILLEIGYNQDEKVKTILSKKGFNYLTVRKDLAGINRLIIGSRTNS